MEAQGALQGPIQAALQPAQDEDRARTSAAAEALAGIVASRSTYEASSGTLHHQACCSTHLLSWFSLYLSMLHGIDCGRLLIAAFVTIASQPSWKD